MKEALYYALVSTSDLGFHIQKDIKTGQLEIYEDYADAVDACGQRFKILVVKVSRKHIEIQEVK